MPELLSQALAFEGLAWLLIGGLLSGVVRGFAGFGTAMIYLPFAGAVLDPVAAIVTLVVMDVIGPAPVAARALPHAHPRDLGRLMVGTMVMLPVGVMVLVAVDPSLFRYLVSGIGLFLTLALFTGLRYRGSVTSGMVYGIGGAAGFLGGVAGIPGPPVILFYMARPIPVITIRANNTIYLLLHDLFLLGVLTLQGRMAWLAVVLGIMVAVPNVIGNLIGARLFHPDKQEIYRYVAYVVIVASALMGLPIWG